MSNEQLDRLLEEARDNPELFHALVFNPEEILDELDYLDRATKGRIVGMDPEELIGGITGVERPEEADCGVTVNCGSTCTHTVSAQGLDEQIRTEMTKGLGSRSSFQPRFR